MVPRNELSHGRATRSKAIIPRREEPDGAPMRRAKLFIEHRGHGDAVVATRVQLHHQEWAERKRLPESLFGITVHGMVSFPLPNDPGREKVAALGHAIRFPPTRSAPGAAAHC